MKKRTGILVLIILSAALVFPINAAASGLQDDKVIFGGNFTLQSGEKINGDLVAFGGNVTIEENARVNGDVAVMGGNLDSNGTINGNLVAMGGFVELGGESRVTGDLTSLGSSLEQAEGAIVEGNLVTGENIPFDFSIPPGVSFLEGELPTLTSLGAPLVSASWFFFRLLIWVGLAVIFILFIEDQVVEINQTAFQQPIISTLTGLGVLLIGPVVLLALLITILLSPVSLIGAFVLIAAWIVGWISLGFEVGKRLAEALKQSWAPPITAGVGIFVTLLMFNGFRQIVPCIGWLPKVIAGMWMMGAVALTRFGTHSYPEREEAFPDSYQPAEMEASVSADEDAPAKIEEPEARDEEKSDAEKGSKKDK